MKQFVTEEPFWELFPDARIGIVVALVCFLIGTAAGKPTDDETGRLFFPEKY